MIDTTSADRVEQRWALATAFLIGGGFALLLFLLSPLLILFAPLPAVFVYYFWRREAIRRRRILRQPFPESWREILDRRVPYYHALAPEARTRFEQEVHCFIADHRFTGIEGVEVTDHHRILIAAGAAMFLFGRPDWRWPRIDNILLYPDAFRDDYTISRRQGNYAGMVHPDRIVIFALPDLEKSFQRPSDGYNVILHELAHILDLGPEGCDGIPQDLAPRAFKPWADLIRREMENVHDRRSMLDDYAGESETEFFAVAVESFFERPAEMAEEHADLYRALAQYFNQDPAAGKPGKGIID